MMVKNTHTQTYAIPRIFRRGPNSHEEQGVPCTNFSTNLVLVHCFTQKSSENGLSLNSKFRKRCRVLYCIHGRTWLHVSSKAVSMNERNSCGPHGPKEGATTVHYTRAKEKAQVSLFAQSVDPPVGLSRSLSPSRPSFWREIITAGCTSQGVVGMYALHTA